MVQLWKPTFDAKSSIHNFCAVNLLDARKLAPNVAGKNFTGLKEKIQLITLVLYDVTRQSEDIVMTSSPEPGDVTAKTKLTLNLSASMGYM